LESQLLLITLNWGNTAAKTMPIMARAITVSSNVIAGTVIAPGAASAQKRFLQHFFLIFFSAHYFRYYCFFRHKSKGRLRGFQIIGLFKKKAETDK